MRKGRKTRGPRRVSEKRTRTIAYRLGRDRGLTPNKVVAIWSAPQARIKEDRPCGDRAVRIFDGDGAIRFRGGVQDCVEKQPLARGIAKRVTSEMKEVAAEASLPLRQLGVSSGVDETRRD